MKNNAMNRRLSIIYSMIDTMKTIENKQAKVAIYKEIDLLAVDYWLEGYFNQAIYEKLTFEAKMAMGK